MNGAEGPTTHLTRLVEDGARRWRAHRRRARAVRRGLASLRPARLAPLRGTGLPKDFSLVPVCPSLTLRGR
ncbi:MAG: hypothetical protein U0Q15_06785 [Kineosporiaceae bacterium]